LTDFGVGDEAYVSDLVNMKVITAIYLNCRPELRDEWLAGQDVDGELEDALVS
jgi:hypothetical protein